MALNKVSITSRAEKALLFFLYAFIIQWLNIEMINDDFVGTQADLTILEHIEQSPDTTQATLAEKIGVAVGTVNWHLKRLITKGYIKVQRAERKKLKYIITPEGIALRARLLVDYIQSSMQLYRLVRDRSLEAIAAIQKDGYESTRVEGDGEVAEILKLTCMEQGIEVEDHRDQRVTLKVTGLKIFIEKKDQTY
jgi:DNA-binding MarR family transcriptional regulator